MTTTWVITKATWVATWITIKEETMLVDVQDHTVATVSFQAGTTMVGEPVGGAATPCGMVVAGGVATTGVGRCSTSQIGLDWLLQLLLLLLVDPHLLQDQ